jgi:hypothetical protein
MRRSPLHRHAFRIMVLCVGLAVTATTSADVPPVPDGAFSLHHTFESFAGEGFDARTGTVSVHYRDGEVRIDVIEDDGAHFVTLFVREADGAYVLYGFEPNVGPWADFELPFAQLLERDILYDQFTDLYLFSLPPESPLHPCRHLAPDGAPSTGTFFVWECAAAGGDVVGGRPATMWELSHSRGQAGHDPILGEAWVLWIDDELGVPLALAEGSGRDTLTFVSIDDQEPAADLFSSPWE